MIFTRRFHQNNGGQLHIIRNGQLDPTPAAGVPAVQASAFAGLRMGEIPGTGQVPRVRFNANGDEIRREALLTDLHVRIRGVHQGADGYLYALTDEDDAAVLKIGTAQ